MSPSRHVPALTTPCFCHCCVPECCPYLRSRRLTLPSGTAIFLPATSLPPAFRSRDRGPVLGSSQPRPRTRPRSHRTGSDTMRTIHLTSVFAALLIAGATPAMAQNPPRGAQPPQPAMAGPYKTVPVTPPPSISDPAFEAFPKQMGE